MTMKGSSELFYDKSNRANATYSGTRNASPEPTPQPRPIALTNSPSGSGKRITAPTINQIHNYMQNIRYISSEEFLDKYVEVVNVLTDAYIENECLDEDEARLKAIHDVADMKNVEIIDLDDILNYMQNIRYMSLKEFLDKYEDVVNVWTDAYIENECLDEDEARLKAIHTIADMKKVEITTR